MNRIATCNKFDIYGKHHHYHSDGKNESKFKKKTSPLKLQLRCLFDVVGLVHPELDSQEGILDCEEELT